MSEVKLRGQRLPWLSRGLLELRQKMIKMQLPEGILLVPDCSVVVFVFFLESLSDG